MSAPFANRHIGPWDHSRQELLDAIGYESLDALVNKVVPEKIHWEEEPELPDALSEAGALKQLKETFSENVLPKPLIGQVHHRYPPDCCAQRSHGGRRGEASHRLWLSRSDNELAGRGNTHDRAD